jgi:nitroreductase
MTLQPVAAIVRDNILARRTNLRIDRDKPVETDTITHLIELATWAPNHRMTEPWRFAVLTGTARSRLGETVAQHMIESGATDPAKLEKTRTKFLRAPVVLMVACESLVEARPDMQLEDRNATAAAVQNLLLSATASGLNSYWGTGAVCDAPQVRAMCGFAPHATVIAAIYLGHSIGDVPVPARRAPVVTWVPS